MRALPGAPPRAAPLAPPAKPGVLDGAGALARGLGFLLSTPSTWPLAVVPALVALVIIASLGGLAIALVPDAVAALLGPAASTWSAVATTALQVAATAVAGALAIVVGLGLAQPLSGPALDGIVRRVDASLGVAPRPETGFVEGVYRSLQSVAVAWAIGLPALGTLFLVGLAFPPAVVVTVPLKLAVAAMLLAWDLCDYPLALRGLPVRERVALVRGHLGAVLGFGVALSLLSLVPCALLLALPAGVAGAARLTADIERRQAHERALTPGGGGRGRS
jgi:CysZ protein